MIRTLRLCAFALLLPVALTGCLKSKEEVTIQKSGAGRASITMEIDTAKLEAIKEMVAGMMGGAPQEGGEDPFEKMDPETMRKELEGKEGIKVVSAETTKDEATGKQRTVMVIEFDSLEHLYRAGVQQGATIKLEKNADGNYVYTRSMGEEMGEGPEAEQMAQMMLAMFEPYMSDMEVVARITLPTTVLETSGTKIDDHTVEWKLGFQDIPKAAARTQTVVFSGEGLDWKPFTITPEDLEEEEAVPAGPVTPGEDSMPGDR